MAEDNKFTNPFVAKLLRSVAAGLSLKREQIFRIRAYETAADAIEHSTAEVKDLWEDGKLDLIPGVGKSIQDYLDEYFKTGKVKHFEQILKDFDPFLFELLDIPGVGPKTALELSKLGLKSFEQLGQEIESGELEEKGISAKMAANLKRGLIELSGRSSRMLLPYAAAQAERILEYLKKGPGVVAADPLGSLRRRVATIGDLDFAVATTKSQETIDYFVKMPGVSEVVDQGEYKAMIVLKSGLHVDLLVGEPENYGALLQHFTGSKHHNIKLRSYAKSKGFSISEYGVRKVLREVTKVTKVTDVTNVKEGEVISCRTEGELYGMLGMDVPEPEIREDGGEIEASLEHRLPKLIEVSKIKGDFHLHSNFPMERPSHGPGINSLGEIVKKAIKLGYSYVGLSDHPPGFRSVSKDWMEKILAARTREIEKLRLLNTKSIRVLNGLEIDILPDGTLSVPDNILQTLDYCIAGVHSGHRNLPEDMTRRILSALNSPFVDIISHPTGRLLNERDSFEADWETIFKVCAKNNKLLEINAFPNRLDLRDDLVRMALSFGCKFIINSDAHEISQMDNMEFGVSVARRGWVEAKDVINSWNLEKVEDWFNL